MKESNDQNESHDIWICKSRIPASILCQSRSHAAITSPETAHSPFAKRILKTSLVIADYYRCIVISLSHYTYYRDRCLAIDHGSLDRAPSIATEPTNPFFNAYTLGTWEGAMQEARFYKNDEKIRGKNYARKREIINLLFDESGTLNKLAFFPLFVQGTLIRRLRTSNVCWMSILSSRSNSD